MKRLFAPLSRLIGEVATPGSFDPRWALFSANSFIAAALAMYVALRLGLQRPYWAMLTVYLTAQPLAGAVRSKAIFRLLGTIVGAFAAVLVVPLLDDEPILLSIAITGWAGLCLFVSLHDRTPRAYAFMLAGYTATTVAFSSVGAPEAVFDTALARVEEIALGICCATIVHSLLFPRDVTTVLLRRVEVSVRDAGVWASNVLHQRVLASEAITRQRLSVDATELEVLSTHIPFDTAASKPKLWAIRALQDCLAVILPLIAAIEDRDMALRSLGGDSEGLDNLMRSVGEWARDPSGSRQTAEGLLLRCERYQKEQLPELGNSWRTLLTLSATAKMMSLIVTLERSRRLSAIIHGYSAESQDVSEPASHRARRRLHADSGLAALTVLALFVAVLSCCSVWILTDWPEGATAAQMAAIYVALFGSLDDAAPSLASFALWTAASLPIAAIYLFVVFPAIDGFPMLIFSLAPAFLTIGYLQASPRHALKALALLIGIIGALDLQIRFSADFASFANVNSAEVIGIVAAFLAMRAFRSITAVGAARRLLRHGWVDLAILAHARRPMRRERWLGVMLDRLGLVVPRLALSGSDVETEAIGSLSALQVGLELIDLRTALDGSNEDRCSASICDLLASLSRFYRQLASDGHVGWPERQTILFAIDGAIREWIARRNLEGVSALVGLRRALFPEALPLLVSAAST